MRLFWLAVLATVLSPTFAAAQASFLECSRIGGRTSSWIPEQFVIAREGESRNVTVSDSIGLPRNLPPSKGQIRRETGSRLTVDWSLKGLRDSRGTVTAAMRYQAVVNKKTGAAKVSARPLGFSEVFTGKAKCAPMAPEKVARLTKLLKNPKVRGTVKQTESKTDTYSCALASKPLDLLFVPQQFVFEVPRSGRNGSVADSFSEKHTGGKVPARVTRKSRGQASLLWKLEDMYAIGKTSSATYVHTEVTFRASLANDGRSLVLRVTHSPWLPPKRYRGSCKLQTAKR